VTTRAGLWIAATGSVRGSSHERDGKPNQDAVRVVAGRDPRAGLVAAVCDGHGGARYVRSDVGSRLGTEVACEVGRRLLDRIGDDAQPSTVRDRLAGEVATEIIQRWRDRVADDHNKRPFVTSEHERAGTNLDVDPFIAYGCTLLLAVVSQRWIGLLQIGDGDVTAVYEARVESPVPGDDRLVGGETTSLCLPSAAADARVAVLSEPLPDVLVLTSDGYANSFASPTWRTEAGVDLRDNCARLGVDAVEERLPHWLAESAAAGGDDVTMALIARESMAVAPGVHAMAQSDPGSVRAGGRRWLVAAGVAAALVVGVGAGWFLGRDESPQTPPSVDAGTDPTTSVTTLAPATTVLSPTTVLQPPATTVTSPTVTTSSVPVDRSTTTQPLPSTTTRPVLPAPVELEPGDVIVELAGSNADNVPTGMVLAFDPTQIPPPSVRLVAQTATIREPLLAEGWSLNRGALRYGFIYCYPALAAGMAGEFVWALALDGMTLDQYDPISGESLGAGTLIEGATPVAAAQPNACNTAGDPGADESTTTVITAAGNQGDDE
jgi:hypothetical protein